MVWASHSIFCTDPLLLCMDVQHSEDVFGQSPWIWLRKGPEQYILEKSIVCISFLGVFEFIFFIVDASFSFFLCKGDNYVDLGINFLFSGYHVNQSLCKKIMINLFTAQFVYWLFIWLKGTCVFLEYFAFNTC